MLVLVRKVGDSIQIGDDITITVLDRKGSSVRLGINAPSGTRVLRAELLNREKPLNLPKILGEAMQRRLLEQEYSEEAVTPSDAQELSDHIREASND